MVWGANGAAFLEFIVSDVSDGATKVHRPLPCSGFRKIQRARNDTSRLVYTAINVTSAR